MFATPSRTLEARQQAVPAARMLVAAVSFAAVLALSAQVRIPLPFTPVPITLQTLALYVGAAWLGARIALAGLGLYVGAALLGMPVMAGLRGGAGAFAGATGGYILGWFIAVLLLSRWLDGASPRPVRAAATMAAGSVVILACGALHLGLLLGLSPAEAILLGVAPFIPGDALKILVASAAVRRWPNPFSLR